MGGHNASIYVCSGCVGACTVVCLNCVNAGGPLSSVRHLWILSPWFEESETFLLFFFFFFFCFFVLFVCFFSQVASPGENVPVTVLGGVGVGPNWSPKHNQWAYIY